MVMLECFKKIKILMPLIHAGNKYTKPKCRQCHKNEEITASSHSSNTKMPKQLHKCKCYGSTHPHSSYQVSTKHAEDVVSRKHYRTVCKRMAVKERSTKA